HLQRRGADHRASAGRRLRRATRSSAQIPGQGTGDEHACDPRPAGDQQADTDQPENDGAGEANAAGQPRSVQTEKTSTEERGRQQHGGRVEHHRHRPRARRCSIIKRSSGRPRTSSAFKPPEAKTATADKSFASVEAAFRSNRNQAPLLSLAISRKAVSATGSPPS